MSLPKRFPDRDEIARVRAEVEHLEAGATDDATKRRLSGSLRMRHHSDDVAAFVAEAGDGMN